MSNNNNNNNNTNNNIPSSLTLHLSPGIYTAGVLLSPFVVMPFRVLSIRQQIKNTWEAQFNQNIQSSLHNANHLLPTNMYPKNNRSLLKSVVTYEGITSLYKGNATFIFNNILRLGITSITRTVAFLSVLNDMDRRQQENNNQSTTTVTANQLSQHTYNTQSSIEVPTYLIFLGLIGECAITYPLHVVSTRLAAQPARHPIKQQQSILYRSNKLFPTIRSVINEAMVYDNITKAKSIRYLYGGFSAYLSWHVTQLISSFFSYHVTQSNIMRQAINAIEQQAIINNNNNNKQDIMTQITKFSDIDILKVVASFAIWPLTLIISYPLLTVTRNMQVHNMLIQVHNHQLQPPHTVTYQAKSYRSAGLCMAQIYKSQGIRGFYNGVTLQCMNMLFVTLTLIILTEPSFGLSIYMDHNNDNNSNDDV